jgi:hypothetical protein
MSKYKYNYENATEKRESQKESGRIDIPYDDPMKHPEHLNQHNHLQILQREALNGNVERCKEMIAELPKHQRKDTIHILKKSVEEHGRTIDLELTKP